MDVITGGRDFAALAPIQMFCNLNTFFLSKNNENPLDLFVSL